LTNVLKKTAILFDMDGTLLDTQQAFGDSMNDFLRAEGFPVFSMEAYRRLLGDTLVNILRAVLPEHKRTDDMIEKGMRIFQQKYRLSCENGARPYDGVKEMLRSLQAAGIKLTILSNSLDNFVKFLVNRFFPEIAFSAVLGIRPGLPKKPDPYGALEIADLLAIDPGRFLCVGDSETDIETALAAGMTPISVSWGYRSVEELKQNGAGIIIDSPDELLDYAVGA